ncbi:MAG: diacylglycerol/lipid kinase family protein, partial [Candidatus Aminicenantia bacterium]
MMDKRKVLVIANPNAGRRKKHIYKKMIEENLGKHFNEVAVRFSNSKGENFSIAKEAKDYFDIIVAFGGDGTINEIGSAILGSNVTLGIIPGGSGNGLARGLKIPLDTRKSLEVIKQGREVFIDVGKMDDKYFFNVAGFGFDAQIARDFNSYSPYGRGIAKYVYCGLKEYSNFKPFKVSANSNGLIFEDEVIIVALANFKEYGGRAVIAPFASPKDGKLEICFLKKIPFLEALTKLNVFFSGQIHTLPIYKSFSTQNVHLKFSRPVPSHYDGETGKNYTEISVTLYPNLLK